LFVTFGDGTNGHTKTTGKTIITVQGVKDVFADGQRGAG
jgi:hypothetical protein